MKLKFRGQNSTKHRTLTVNSCPVHEKYKGEGKVPLALGVKEAECFQCRQIKDAVEWVKDPNA